MPTLKERLGAGDLVVGTMVSEVRNPNVAHLLALAGFEFLVIDNEHGSYSDETVSDMIAGARGAGLPVIVRIPEVRRATILKPLDAGAAGLLVPMVDTPEQAAEVVRHAKYPPQGQRGAALRRPHSLYGRVEAAAYLAQANRDTFIAVQAETRRAIANVQSIAAVEGVDCVFAGPFDLSVDIGQPGQLDHPDEVAAMERMIAGCQARGKVPGTLMFDATMLGDWIRRGMRFVVYSGDMALLADAATKAVAELKRSATQLD
jgi:2-dehydro-3-deoxyglucarate aldolase/4-hydroxy-2-oxoheptanedioate aldolase